MLFAIPPILCMNNASGCNNGIIVILIIRLYNIINTLLQQYNNDWFAAFIDYQKGTPTID